MDALEQWVADVWGPLAADVSVKVVALVGLAWVVGRLGRLRAPAAQHALWAMVLVGMLALPVVSRHVPAWRIPVIPAEVKTPVAESASPIAAIPDVGAWEPVEGGSPERAAPATFGAPAPAPMALPSPAPAIETSWNWPAWPVWVLGAYLLGSALLLARAGIGVLLVRRTVRRCRPIERNTWALGGL